jgi:iron complex outermembrane recepter protein
MRNTRSFFSTTAIFATAIAGLSVAAPAHAQDAEADDSGLSEIVVTAQRREQNLQDVPLSVTALSEEKLDVIGSSGVDVRGLSGRVPSLLVESSFGRTFPRFYIRGLGNTDFDLNASQPVSLVYDEVVLENPILKGFPIFDLDRVEVLRGPQGTLFGRNTPAGIVKFDSAKPKDEVEGFGRISYGRFNNINAQGAINAPLGDKVAIRISALYQKQDDYIDNVLPSGTTKNALAIIWMCF